MAKRITFIIDSGDYDKLKGKMGDRRMQEYMEWLIKQHVGVEEESIPEIEVRYPSASSSFVKSGKSLSFAGKSEAEILAEAQKSLESKRKESGVKKPTNGTISEIEVL